MNKKPRICVYCGSRNGADPTFAAAARELGRLIGERGCDLVYGGGRVGLMGELADASLAAGAKVIGVIPESLMRREVAHMGLTELVVVPDMHHRKRRMAEGADAFVAMAGGLGTLEEFFEVWTWRHLNYHHLPIGVLDTSGYFQPLLKFLEHARTLGFIGDDQMAMIQVSQTARELLNGLLATLAKPTPSRTNYGQI